LSEEVSHQTFQLSRFYRESPENSCNLPVSRFLSNSPDFSEYSGNIIKNDKYTVFSNIIVCLDLFWSCFMAIYRITYNNIFPKCRKCHFRRLNFYYFSPEEPDFNSLNSLPNFYLQWLECLSHWLPDKGKLTPKCIFQVVESQIIWLNWLINCWRFIEGSDTAEISYTRLRNQLKSNPKSRNHERN
jgi:hypothetical protein